MIVEEIVPLPDTLEPKILETPQSFIARIAAMNAAGSAREFCRDFLLDFDKIANGVADEIGRLAILTGADADDLMRGACVATGTHAFAVNGEKLTSARARRTRLRACVDCMAEDMAAAPDLPGDAAIACRAYFLIDPIRTCPIHGRAFVQISDERSLGEHRGDYSLALADAIEDIDLLRSESACRPQSPFERYLMGRFGFAERLQVELLDPLAVTDVTMVCERIGVFHMLGRKGRLGQLDEDGRSGAGQAGFEVLAGGASGLRDFVTEAYETATTEERRGLSNTIFGRFHYFLNSETSEDLVPIKQVIADRLSELLPYGPDDEPLFGVRFSKRYWHTLISAERQYGIPYRTIRQDVVGAGIADRINLRFSKTRFIIDAAKLAELYGSGDTVVSRRRVIYETGAHAHDFAAFDEAGLLSPVERGETPAGDRYRQGAVRALVTRMLGGTERLAGEVPGMVAVRDAYALTDWSRAEVMSMIADGRVRHGSVTGQLPLASLRVDLDQLRELHPLHGRDYLSMGEAAAILRVSETVFKRLIQGNWLPWFRLRHPGTGKLRFMFSKDDIEAFSAAYMPVSEIWMKRGRQLSTINSWLRSHGLEPAFPPADLRCTFYRRTEVTPLLDGLSKTIPATPETEEIHHAR